MIPFASWARTCGSLRLERPGGEAVAGGELGVDALRAPVGELDRPEELLLEPLGRVVVELLVGLAQIGQRGPELVGRRGERVEHLLPALRRRVAHRRRG